MIYLIYSATSSTEIAIEDYIDDDATKKVFSRQFLAVNTIELGRSDGMSKLTEFVRESFRAHYDGRNNDKVKQLDHMTKDLSIPSRSGSNIANDLNVSSDTNFISLVKFI